MTLFFIFQLYYLSLPLYLSWFLLSLIVIHILINSHCSWLSSCLVAGQNVNEYNACFNSFFCSCHYFLCFIIFFVSFYHWLCFHNLINFQFLWLSSRSVILAKDEWKQGLCETFLYFPSVLFFLATLSLRISIVIDCHFTF